MYIIIYIILYIARRNQKFVYYINCILTADTGRPESHIYTYNYYIHQMSNLLLYKHAYKQVLVYNTGHTSI